LFAAALGLGKPWKIENVRFDGAEGLLAIELGFERGAKFPHPEDASRLCPVHDVKEKRWRHLDFFQHRTELIARVPRVRGENGKVAQVEVPWARPGSGFTLLMEAFVLTLCKEMPVAAVARLVNEHDTRLWRVIRHYVDEAWEEASWEGLTRIAIDETATRKGHRYGTGFVEIRGGEASDEPLSARLLYLTPGKGAETVEAFAAECRRRGLAPETGIEEAAIDRSKAFIKGVGEHLPAAAICFDRFHVMKLCGEACDRVRKEIAQREGVNLPRAAMWSLRGNAGRLSTEARETREALIRQYAEIGRALALREYLQDTWKYASRAMAEEHLHSFCSWAQRSRLKPFVELARTLRRHWEGILNYYRHYSTSALIEAINGKLQLARRKARGYRNFANFRAIAYWIAGGLHPSPATHTR
jgi:transposase